MMSFSLNKHLRKWHSPGYCIKRIPIETKIYTDNWKRKLINLNNPEWKMILYKMKYDLSFYLFDLKYKRSYSIFINNKIIMIVIR